MQRERWSIPVLGTFHAGVKMRGVASYHRGTFNRCRHIFSGGDRGHSARVSVVSISVLEQIQM